MADAVKQEETNKQPEQVKPGTASGDASSDKALQDLLQKYKDELTAKLEEEKKEWAAQAKENPDTARRELRKFWLVVSAFTFVLGIAASNVYHAFF